MIPQALERLEVCQLPALTCAATVARQYPAVQVEAIAKARDWTAGMAAYDLVLAKMKSVGAAVLPSQPSGKTSRKKRKQPEEPSAAPQPAAASLSDAAPQSLKNDSKKEKKVKKKRKSSGAAGAATDSKPADLSTAALSSTAEALPATTQVTIVQPVASATAARARGRHIGRYHKTAAAKKAGAYSQSDLAAILGVDSFPIAAPITATSAAAAAAAATPSSDQQVCTQNLSPILLLSCSHSMQPAWLIYMQQYMECCAAAAVCQDTARRCFIDHHSIMHLRLDCEGPDSHCAACLQDHSEDITFEPADGNDAAGESCHMLLSLPM